MRQLQIVCQEAEAEIKDDDCFLWSEDEESSSSGRDEKIWPTIEVLQYLEHASKDLSFFLMYSLDQKSVPNI